MTMEEEQKESAFKVVDKRRFNESGDSRTEEDVKAQKSVANEKSNVSSAPELGQESARPPMSFSLFIQSLAHQAMMGLGLVPWPDSGLIKVDVDLAKEFIDLIKILKEKTEGNLSDEEKTLVDGLLYQLQVMFVEKVKGPVDGAGPIIK